MVIFPVLRSSVLIFRSFITVSSIALLCVSKKNTFGKIIRMKKLLFFGFMLSGLNPLTLQAQFCAPDTSFSDDGRVTTLPLPVGGEANAIAIQLDGKIVVGG